MLQKSENNLNNYFSDVIRNVAKELKLQDMDLLHDSEIFEQIKNENTAVFEKLESFFTAYKKWLAFDAKIYGRHNAGNVSKEWSNEIKALTLARDFARNSLLETLRK